MSAKRMPTPLPAPRAQATPLFLPFMRERANAQVTGR